MCYSLLNKLFNNGDTKMYAGKKRSKPKFEIQEQLFNAVRVGDVHTFESLLTEDYIDIMNEEDKSLAFVAAEEGHQECLNILRACNANLHFRDNSGNTLANIAALRGRLPCLEFLAEQGVDLNRPNKVGNTSAHSAAAGGHEDCLQFVLEQGVNKDQKNRLGYTPAHYAAQLGNQNCLNLLAAHGADLNAGDRNGRTPGDFARIMGYEINTTPPMLEAAAEEGPQAAEQPQRSAMTHEGEASLTGPVASPTSGQASGHGRADGGPRVP